MKKVIHIIKNLYALARWPFVLVFVILFLSVEQGCSQYEGRNQEQFPREVMNILAKTDFSYAGYKTGNSKPNFFPVPKDYPVFNITDFGAIPNDGQDDIEAIQKAVDAASKAGKGVIIFPRGQFDFDVDSEKRFVHIKSSNIQLVGWGEEIGGTVLFDHHASSYPDPDKKWLAGLYPSFFHVGKLDVESESHPTDDPENLVATLVKGKKGEHIIELQKDFALEVPGTYLLTMEGDSLARELVKPLQELGSSWIDSTGFRNYKVQQLIKIVGRDGDRLLLDAPNIDEVSSLHNPKLWKVPYLLSNVAIVGMRMKTAWDETFQHHLNSEHDNGWDHINLKYCEDCWVRNIVHDGATTGVHLSSGKNCSIWDCRIQGNSGHNGFVLSGSSTRNLLYNLWGDRAFHTFSLNHYSCGNVFYNCHAGEPSAIDLHGSLCHSNLFDNVSGLHFEHGGGKSALPPAHAHELVIWNWQVGLMAPYKGMVKQGLGKIEEIPGFVMVGVRGIREQPIHFENSNGEILNGNFINEWGTCQNWGEVPTPKSLYEYQKSKRNKLSKRDDEPDE